MDNLFKFYVSGIYLIREWFVEVECFVISIKFNDEVKYIKVVEKDNWIYIIEVKKFDSFLELVEYYQCYLFKESFKQLDIIFKYFYKFWECLVFRVFSWFLVFMFCVIGMVVVRYNFVV